MDTDELENEQMKAGRTIDVRIDAVISDMMNEERRLLALRRHRTAETVTYMQLVQVTGTIMSFAILLVTFLRLRRETVRRFLRAAIASSVEWLESQGVPDRPFLVGDRLTIADLTAAALLAPLACPDEHPIYGAARYRAGIAPLVGAWQDGRAFQWIRQTYRLHRGTWPRGSEIRRAIDAV
jgi:glutathione S-transferase